MKDHPIPFSGEMVRVILAWRKTQTRLIIKEIAKDNTITLMSDPFGWLSASTDRADRRKIGKYCAFFKRSESHLYLNTHETIPFPYGEVGDRLWVREKWEFVPWDQDKDFKNRTVLVVYAADGGQSRPISVPDDWNPMLYNDQRWRPSIHMPRWASRITLEITGVRVERVQDISEEDAIAEGVPGIATNQPYPKKFRDSFEVLWNLIYAKRGFGWDVNPWVWIIDFKPISLPSEPHTP